jgi:hypothetical protein
MIDGYELFELNLIFPNWEEFVGDYSKSASSTKFDKKKYDGMSCASCKDFNKYISEPNQDDGTYICYKCRKGI